MYDVLILATTVIALVGAAGAALCVVRDRPPGRYLAGTLGLLELGLLAVSVAGLIRLATGDREVAAGTLIAYLLAVLVLVPAATLWALVERTRFGTAVIVIACLAVPAMTARVQQVWDAGHVR
jgi:hypothetical protein